MGYPLPTVSPKVASFQRGINALTAGGKSLSAGLDALSEHTNPEKIAAREAELERLKQETEQAKQRTALGGMDVDLQKMYMDAVPDALNIYKNAAPAMPPAAALVVPTTPRPEIPGETRGLSTGTAPEPDLNAPLNESGTMSMLRRMAEAPGKVGLWGPDPKGSSPTPPGAGRGAGGGRKDPLEALALLSAIRSRDAGAISRIQSARREREREEDPAAVAREMLELGKRLRGGNLDGWEPTTRAGQEALAQALAGLGDEERARRAKEAEGREKRLEAAEADTRSSRAKKEADDALRADLALIATPPRDRKALEEWAQKTAPRLKTVEGMKEFLGAIGASEKAIERFEASVAEAAAKAGKSMDAYLETQGKKINPATGLPEDIKVGPNAAGRAGGKPPLTADQHVENERARLNARVKQMEASLESMLDPLTKQPSRDVDPQRFKAQQGFLADAHRAVAEFNPKKAVEEWRRLYGEGGDAPPSPSKAPEMKAGAAPESPGAPSKGSTPTDKPAAPPISRLRAIIAAKKRGETVSEEDEQLLRDAAKAEGVGAPKPAPRKPVPPSGPGPNDMLQEPLGDRVRLPGPHATPPIPRIGPAFPVATPDAQFEWDLLNMKDPVTVAEILRTKVPTPSGR